MKRYYAHTAANEEGETLFSFRRFPGRRMTAPQKFIPGGKHYLLNDAP
jgi:hypothetical protein